MDLNALIIRITNLQQELAGHTPLKGDVQEKLDKKFRLEFNYNSNHIEGNTLTYGETELYLIFDKTTGNHDGREYEEMRASDAALKMIQEYAAEKERPLTEAFIKSLNELILVRPYWVDAMTPSGQPTRRQIVPGGYKKQPNSVRLQNGEMFHYTSPEDTPIQMGELVEWYRAEIEKNELHPVALAALLHYKFVRIHPFDDGNGRISRLLMNYVLYANDLPPVVVKSADKKNYLFALNQADAGDINAFVEYIARQLVWSLELSIKAAKGENIEEQDDLEKEIEVWKKGIRNVKVPTIAKSFDSIHELYAKQVLPFIALLSNKSRIFREVILEWDEYISLQGMRVNVDADIKKMLTPIEGLKSMNVAAINTIAYFLQMKGFRSNPQKISRITTNVVFELNTYSYAVSVTSPGATKQLTKAYDEPLTTSEQNEIVSHVVKSIFDYIKSQTES